MRLAQSFGGNMKKTLLLVLLLVAAAASAQTMPSDQAALAEQPAPDGTQATSANFPIERVHNPTYADWNCAGFISKDLIPNSKYVEGNLESPLANRSAVGELIYLNGTGYQVGQQYMILRELRDVNEFEVFPGQHKLLKATGQPYAEISRARIVDTRHKVGIARIEFSCDATNPGDFAVPYVEKPTVALHPPVRFDRYALSNGKASGRIVTSRDFDFEIGTGHKVYMNIGANQGLKVGDYLRASRSYTATLTDPVDSISFGASTSEDTQKREPVTEPNFLNKRDGVNIRVADLPEHGVGEVLVLSTTPTTSTGMIVFSVEDLHAGDLVQLDESAQ
jgi:hypothetical protein